LRVAPFLLSKHLTGRTNKEIFKMAVQHGDASPSPYPSETLHPHSRLPVARIRELMAEQVIIRTDLDPFLSLKALADYSGLRVRKLRTYLYDYLRPLPHYRVGGKILVRRSEFDAWISTYRHVGDAAVERIVPEVLGELH
jgi:Helix-turn-helix domain